MFRRCGAPKVFTPKEVMVRGEMTLERRIYQRNFESLRIPGKHPLETPDHSAHQNRRKMISIRTTSALSRRFRTLETCQRPPRRVIIPRQFSWVAISRRLVAPLARISATTSARSAAKWSAFRVTAAL